MPRGLGEPSLSRHSSGTSAHHPCPSASLQATAPLGPVGKEPGNTFLSPFACVMMPDQRGVWVAADGDVPRGFKFSAALPYNSISAASACPTLARLGAPGKEVPLQRPSLPKEPLGKGHRFALFLVGHPNEAEVRGAFLGRVHIFTKKEFQQMDLLGYTVLLVNEVKNGRENRHCPPSPCQPLWEAPSWAGHPA